MTPRKFFTELSARIYDRISPDTAPEYHYSSHACNSYIPLSLNSATNYYELCNARKAFEFQDAVEAVLDNKKQAVIEKFVDNMQHGYDSRWNSFLSEVSAFNYDADDLRDMKWEKFLPLLREYQTSFLDDELQSMLNASMNADDDARIIVRMRSPCAPVDSLTEADEIRLEIIFALFDRAPDAGLIWDNKTPCAFVDTLCDLTGRPDMAFIKKIKDAFYKTLR